MKKTLLQLTQDILSDMNSDEVNSITDSLESLQVAQIIRSVYEEMIAAKNWPHLRTLMQLNASGDSDKPTHMKLPDDIKELVEIQYNSKKVGDTREKFELIEYMHPDAFIRHTNNRNSDNADVDVVTDVSGVSLLIMNDKAPEFWTSFDDEWIVFDSYDSEVESTLQKSKSQCIAFRLPTFSVADNFTPDLPAEAFPALLAEAKSTCFLRLKQMPDQKAEQQATRQKNWLSRKAWQAKGGIRFPDYGRRSRKGRA